jgi:hypothetical protein
MAKGQKPADQMEAFSKDAMAQAHQVIDTYFDFLKKTVSSFPTGGTELGERLKDQSVQNVTAVHDLVRRLSQAKDFEEALRTQTEFIQSQFQAFGERMRSLSEGYSKEPASEVKVPFKSSLN